MLWLFLNWCLFQNLLLRKDEDSRLRIADHLKIVALEKAKETWDYGLRLEAELSIFQWIETWYNRRRIHSTLGYKTIEEFEIEMFNQNVAA